MSNTKFNLLFYLKRPKDNYFVEVPVYLRITVAEKIGGFYLCSVPALSLEPQIRASGREKGGGKDF